MTQGAFLSSQFCTLPDSVHMIYCNDVLRRASH